MIRYNQTHAGGEIKAVDVVGTAGTNTQAAFTLNTTAQFTCLNLLTAGSSAWNRIGRKVSLKSVFLQGYTSPTGSANAIELQFARIMIVYDKQPNGALPALADVLRDQANLATDSNVTLITSGLNLNNKDRFEIIADERLALPGPNAAVTPGVVSATCDSMHVEIYRKLGNREVHYKADSSPGVIGDLATGSLFLLTFGDNASGNEAWGLTASIRLRYSDL